MNRKMEKYIKIIILSWIPIFIILQILNVKEFWVIPAVAIISAVILMYLKNKTGRENSE